MYSLLWPRYASSIVPSILCSKTVYVRLQQVGSPRFWRSIVYLAFQRPPPIACVWCIYQVLGITIGFPAPMADRPYSGFSNTSERTAKKMRCRYRTFSSNSKHSVYPFFHIFFIGVVWFHSRLCSAHARIYRGCRIGKSRPQKRQYCQGVHTLNIHCILMKINKTLDGIGFNEPATTFAIHAKTKSSSCCSNNADPEHQEERQEHSVYKYMPGINYVV